MKRISLLMLFLLCFQGCKIGTTGEALIEYPLYGQGTSQAVAFESTDGWSIELSEASMVIGPLYLCSHQPTFSKSGDSLTDCGKTMGEFNSSEVFDALSDEEQELGVIDGLSGQVNSIFYDHGWLWLTTMGEPLAQDDELNGKSVRITGRATKDASSFDFIFELELKPIQKGLQTVMGVGVATEGTEDTEKMIIQADPRHWLRNVKFNFLYDMGEDPLYLSEDTGTYNTIYFGITSSSPLVFEWE
jgi:hypothetical protein